MPAPAVDYDALAQEHGGQAAVDYDALAAEHGGAAQEQPKPGGVRGFLGAAAENLVPEAIRHPSMVADVPGAVGDLLKANQDPVAATALQFGKDAIQASQQASQEQANKGNTLGAIGAAVPLIGPAAAQAGEEIGRGDFAQGLGHAAGMLVPFAAGPAGKALGKVIQPAGEAAAAGAVNSLIKPLEKEFRFGRNPGAGISEEGIVARNLPQLAEKTRAKLDAVGKVIGSKLDTPEANAKLIDLGPLKAPLDEAIAKAKRVNDTALVNHLESFRDSPLLTEKQFVTPAEAHEIKGIVGEETRWTGQPFDKPANQAKAAVYRNINDAIEQAVPGIKSFQSRYADLLSAVKSIERTSNVAEKASLLSLMDLAAAGLGAKEGGPLGAVGAAALRRLGGSTMAQTVMAQALRRAGLLPPLIGDTTRVVGTAKRVEPSPQGQ